MTDADLTQQDVAAILCRAFAPEGFFVEMGVASLIAYEYLITLDAECKVIWSRKWTVPTLLFIINRYSLLLLGVSVLLWLFGNWGSDSGCAVAGSLQSACGVIIYACCTMFSALRIHAVNNGNWFWTVLIVMLGFEPILLNLISAPLTRYVAVPPPLGRCAESTSSISRLDIPTWNRLAVSSEICIIIQDAVVLGITWYRTAGIAMAARKVHLKTSLVDLMLRDGTTFFSLSLALHVIVIVVDNTRQTSLGLITCTFMSIIMTRFILNLRLLDASEAGSSFSFSVPSSLMPSGSLRFRSSRLFDNIAAPLDIEGLNEDLHDDRDDDTDGAHQELIPRRGPDKLGEYSAVPEGEPYDVHC